MKLLMVHLVGDFLLQNDWMAKNKKRSHLVCTVHVATYILPFLFLRLRWWQLAIIAIQHWLQDRWEFILWFMRVAGKTEFSGPPFAPWSHFVVDAIFHMLTIVLVTGASSDGRR